jgi:hypothetical protein
VVLLVVVGVLGVALDEGVLDDTGVLDGVRRVGPQVRVGLASSFGKEKS